MMRCVIWGAETAYVALELQFQTFLNLELGRGEWSASRFGHLTTREKGLVNY